MTLRPGIDLHGSGLRHRSGGGAVSDARAYAEHAARGWDEGSSATFIIAQTPGGAGLGMIELHFFEADPGLAGSRLLATPGSTRARRGDDRGTAGGELGLRQAGHRAAEPDHGTRQRGVPAGRQTCRIHPRGATTRLGSTRRWPPRQHDVLPAIGRPVLTAVYKLAGIPSVRASLAAGGVQTVLQYPLGSALPKPDDNAESDDRDHQPSQADPVPHRHLHRLLNREPGEGESDVCPVPRRHNPRRRT
jgi:hypothetical protein